MVPTYATKHSRRYAYYETRKDLARPTDPQATRFVQGQLERHLLGHLIQLLEDVDALRRMSGIKEAGQLQKTLESGQSFACQLVNSGYCDSAIRGLVKALQVRADRIEVELDATALAIETEDGLLWSIPLPDRKPFRQAKLKIDPKGEVSIPNRELVSLIADAIEARKLVINSPGLSINQVAKREGRCRKQLTKLVRISWLSPRIVESITSGTQPSAINRTTLLQMELPADWTDQEAMLGL